MPLVDQERLDQELARWLEKKEGQPSWEQASTFIHFGALLRKSGRFEEAADAVASAVESLRELADDRPEEFLSPATALVAIARSRRSQLRGRASPSGERWRTSTPISSGMICLWRCRGSSIGSPTLVSAMRQ